MNELKYWIKRKHHNKNYINGLEGKYIKYSDICCKTARKMYAMKK